MHDIYGFALAAQPGESQRRPATNASSQLIEYIGLPAPSCSRSLCPGWSHHTPQPRRLQQDFGSDSLIPVTNAIESLHMTLRKIIKTRGSFPTDDAATKLLYLALRNVKKGWKRSTREWTAALNQFAILFGDRLAASAR